GTFPGGRTVRCIGSFLLASCRSTFSRRSTALAMSCDLSPAPYRANLLPSSRRLSSAWPRSLKCLPVTMLASRLLSVMAVVPCWRCGRGSSPSSRACAVERERRSQPHAGSGVLCLTVVPAVSWAPAIGQVVRREGSSASGRHRALTVPIDVPDPIAYRRMAPSHHLSNVVPTAAGSAMERSVDRIQAGAWTAVDASVFLSLGER